MAKISLDGLDAMQYDVLKEIGNIGAGDEAGNRTYERPILRRLFYEDGCKRD
jgi:hypothetical protein